MDETNEDFKSFITVNFGPNWDNIGITRRFIAEMVYTEVKAANARTISAAASELMENACKYSCFGCGYVSICVFYNSKNLKIQVMNITTSAQILELEKRIAASSQGDPESAYRNAMLDSYNKNPEASQLGLSKIRYECNTNIALKVLDEIPDTLVSADKREKLFNEFSDAKAIEVSIVCTIY